MRLDHAFEMHGGQIEIRSKLPTYEKCLPRDCVSRASVEVLPAKGGDAKKKPAR
jgi:hypothetical protein